MKVIHILHELKYSGAEIMYVDAAPIFQSKGCELTVVATAPDLGEYAPYFEKAGYKVLHMPYPPLSNYPARIQFFRRFTQFLKKEGYDVMHIHSQMWGMSLCVWLAGMKSVYTFHNNFPTNSYSHFYHIMLRWTSKHLFKCRFQTISDSVYNHEIKLYHNPTTKIYNWYSNKKFYPAEQSEKISIRKEFGISPDALVLISVGGCSPIKRHSDIIKALPLILKKVPDCVYLHLGKGVSEDSEVELVKELNVQDHVLFCGNQSNVRKYHAASDIYIMPSQYEGIPISTIEAMGCKVPAILYNVPGLKDFNKDGENSLLIPEDYTLVAENAIRLFEDKKLAEQIGSKGFAFVNNYFSMEKNASLIYEMYL